MTIAKMSATYFLTTFIAASASALTIQAKEATKKEDEVIVAIIDTGADTSHSAIHENLWQNPGETGLDIRGKDKATNGIDDDQNGFIDDVHGWNFASNTNDVTDRHGHGTHIAGIIVSTAPKAKIMILKFFEPKSPGAANMLNTVRAIQYATKMKARMINYSGGGTDQNPAEKAAIANAGKQNILFIAAAGNERTNSDINGFYPAGYGLTNIISVTAVDQQNQVLDSSNYGVRTVDIAAPGKDIVSALPGQRFGKMTGTSQATAFVTGAAALLLAANSNLQDPNIIASRLRLTGHFQTTLLEKTKSESIVDFGNLLTMKDQDRDAMDTLIPMHDRSVASFAARLSPDVMDLGESELPFSQTRSAGKPGRLAKP